MKPKIWIITELFFPNESATAYILTEIAKAFTSIYEVNVICADTNYEKDENRVIEDNEGNFIPGINIVRVRVPELDKNSLVKRFLRFIIISRSLYRESIKRVDPQDTVFAVTNPALLLLNLQKLKKRKRMKYILLVHDVFPENAIASGVIKISWLFPLVKIIFDKAYAAADRILVLGDEMKKIVSSKIRCRDKVFVCENWGEKNIKPRTRNVDGKIVLQYAGNIGRVQGLDKFLSVISRLKNERLIFDLWGNGALLPRISSLISKNSISNIRIRGSYNRYTQNDVLNDCDLALITLAKGMKGLGVPSKTYNILAAGKPILYVGDRGSEIYNLVNKYDLGVVYDWDQTDLLSEWLNSLTLDDLDNLREKGKNSRSLYESSYSQDIIMRKIVETVCSC